MPLIFESLSAPLKMQRSRCCLLQHAAAMPRYDATRRHYAADYAMPLRRRHDVLLLLFAALMLVVASCC